MSEADEVAIRAILADQDSAWTRGDAAGFSGHMADNFLATNVQGQSMSGKELFDRQHAFIFGGFFKGSRMTQTIETLVKVSKLTDPPAFWPLDPEGRLETRLLQILEKSSGSWSIIAYHNVIVNHRAPPLAA